MIYVFEAGNEFWHSPSVRAAVREAFEASRRIEKELDVAREVGRLGVALRTIEQMIVGKCPSPRLLNDSDAGPIIEDLPKIGPVRLPFFLSADADKAHISYFVLIVPFTDGINLATGLGTTGRAARVGAGVIEQNTAEPRGRSGGLKLSNRIAMASSDKRGVALGSCRHAEVTKSLRGFLHASETRAPFTVNFIYKDGSAGGEVHLRKLAQRDRPVTSMDLNAAVESCRHFDLDAAIDFCVLRNADIGRRDDATFADQEAIAYARARACLDELCGADGLHLRLFHTGLEPAVIGIYRAVIDALLLGHRLQVTPVFFVNGKDEESWW